MSSSNKVAAFVIAVVGGGLGILAFFALPLISVVIFSITAQQMAGAASQVGIDNNAALGLDLYWLAPILGGLIALIAALQFRSTASVAGKRAAGGWLIVLGVVGLVLYIGEMIFIVSQINAAAASSGSSNSFSFSYVGIGFWAYLIAMICAIVGGAMARSGSAQVGAFSPPPPVTYTQYQQPSSPQYPQYQQPSSPQYPQYQQPSSPQYPQYQQPSSPQYPPPQRSSEGQQWPPKQ